MSSNDVLKDIVWGIEYALEVRGWDELEVQYVGDRIELRKSGETVLVLRVDETSDEDL